MEIILVELAGMVLSLSPGGATFLELIRRKKNTSNGEFDSHIIDAINIAAKQGRRTHGILLQN